MAIFEIEMGGKTYEVDAPDQNTALSAFAPQKPPSQANSLAGSLTGASAPLSQDRSSSGPLAFLQDIPTEMAGAAVDAGKSFANNLNPFSDERRASMERQSQMPFFSPDSFKEQFGRLGMTGKGMTAPLDLAASPVVGTGRSIIGHGMEAITPGMDYQGGKDAADTAMMGLRANGLTQAGQMKMVPAKTPSPGQAKEAARLGYKSPEVANLEINPQAPATLSSKIESDLLGEGFRPTKTSARDVFGEVKNLTPEQGVQSVNAADMDSARKAMALYAKERDQFGKSTPQAVAAQKAMKHIDDFMDNISANDVIKGDPAAVQGKLKEARANWASGSKAEEIDFRLSRAERQAAKSGSGSNIENARRQKIDQVSEYGLTSEEKKLRDKIVLGSPTRNVLRKAGKAGVDGGLSLMMHAMAAFGTGGLSLPIAAAGTAARKAGEFLTAREIKLLQKMIMERSPLAKSQPATQMLPPTPLLGSVMPYGVPQSLPMLMGGIPAHADDEQYPYRRR